MEATGLPGLDSLIEGGIPKGSTIMIAGNSGRGKTILCSQFVYDGFNKDRMDYVFPLVNPKHSFIPTSKHLGWILINSKDKESLHFWILLH